MRSSRVVEEVRLFVKAHGIADGGVVAVSGGADSVSLLRALLEAGCGPLTAAHLNHQLRGPASDDDEAFVGNLAKSLGIGFRSTRIDVSKVAAESRENVEATARRVRYNWLAEVANEVGAKWIATGHTADDQAETILHRLIRGTGLQGLRGIAAVRSNLVRPLLTVTRAEILGYLASLAQPFRDDTSNLDARFTRNRIRAELLPLLKSFNPEVVPILGRLTEQASEAHDVMIQQAQSLLQSAERPRAGDRVILDQRKLRDAAPLLLSSALRLVWEREGWPMGEMTSEHWHRAAAVIRGEERAAEFPGGMTVRTAGQVVQVWRQRN